MKLLLVLFVAVAFVATGEALECYTCGSWPRVGCDDSFDKSTAKKTTCTSIGGLTPVCMKGVGEFSNGTIRTVRDCVPNIYNGKKSLDRAGVSLKSESTYYCDSNLCNGGSTTSAAVSMLMVLALPFIFRNHH